MKTITITVSSDPSFWGNDATEEQAHYCALSHALALGAYIKGHVESEVKTETTTDAARSVAVETLGFGDEGLGERLIEALILEKSERIWTEAWDGVE